MAQPCLRYWNFFGLSKSIIYSLIEKERIRYGFPHNFYEDSLLFHLFKTTYFLIVICVSSFCIGRSLNIELIFKSLGIQNRLRSRLATKSLEKGFCSS